MTNPGTARNAERTGKRTVSRLSSVARKVENVRHYDCDLYQVCARCKYPQLFAEVKSYDASDSEWLQTRLLADSFDCIAILVIEKGDDLGVKTYNSLSGIITPLIWGRENYLLSILKAARDRHECLQKPL
jgi:hypothetical protein